MDAPKNKKILWVARKNCPPDDTSRTYLRKRFGAKTEVCHIDIPETPDVVTRLINEPKWDDWVFLGSKLKLCDLLNQLPPNITRPLRPKTRLIENVEKPDFEYGGKAYQLECFERVLQATLITEEIIGGQVGDNLNPKKIWWAMDHKPGDMQIAVLEGIFGPAYIDIQPLRQDKCMRIEAGNIIETFTSGGYNEIVLIAPPDVIHTLCLQKIRPLIAIQRIREENDGKLVFHRFVRAVEYIEEVERI